MPEPELDLNRRAAEILAAVLEVRRADRDLVLRSWCGDNDSLRREVDELLAYHDSAIGPLDRSPLEMKADEGQSIAAGSRIGQFIVESLIGEGGMGVVYLCRQERPNRHVAVKLIRPWFATPAVLKRFEYEAEVLGRLQHPGIASIIEAGTVANGNAAQPYFAMEYVKGIAIDRSCRERQLSVRERVTLIAAVCDAVAHAHQRGIIHRDIKPDNILIDERGEPKVLDFGVARATGRSVGEQRDSVPVTVAQQLVGTLAYMSPEQTAGASTSVDTRADVYGLGATLFEVLTDQLPLDLADKSLPEAIHAIQSGRARRMGDVDPRLRGDLETIVLKALALEPARRYQTVGDFSTDLRRWLADEPIAARPPSALYQLRKFAKRRRGAVIGGTVAVVALMIGLVVATSAWRRASSARDDRGQVAAFLAEMVRSIDPALAEGGDTSALKLMLDQTAARIDSKLTDQPDVQVELLGIVAQGYAQLGAFEEAEAATDRSLAFHRRLDGNVSARVASDIALIGRIRLMRGETDFAEARLNDALEMRQSILGDRHSDVGASLTDLAEVSSVRGNYVTTEELLRRAIDIQHGSTAPEARERLAQALCRLAPVVERGARMDEARDSLNEAIAIFEELHGRRDATVATCLCARGDLALNQHDIVGGEQDYREALAIRTAALGADHSLTAEARQMIAQLMAFRGDAVEAERFNRVAVDSTRRSFGPNSPAYALALGNFGQLLASIGKRDDAEAALNEAIAIFDRFGGNRQASARRLRVDLMDLWRERLDFERALPVVRQLLESDETSTTISDVDRQGVLMSATETFAVAAWNRVAKAPNTDAAAEAPALAARAIELSHPTLENSAERAGYLRYYPRLYASAALVSHVLASWTKANKFDRDAAVDELMEAERLLALGYEEAKSSNEVLPPPKSRDLAVQMFEGWTMRLYWLWSQIARDERVVAEFHRCRATDGGKFARLPLWASEDTAETNHGGSLEPP